MSQRYDALSVRESNGKAYFTKCGAMFPNKNGDGFVLSLDVMPASVDGQFKIILKIPQERDDNPRGRSAAADRQQSSQRSGSFSDDLDDNIPPF